MQRLFHSLLMTAIVSFLVPFVLIGSLCITLLTVQSLAVILPVEQPVLPPLMRFLGILGSGSPWHGLMVIGITSSAVGILFDTFTFYRGNTLSQR